jgi:rhodanese-related sulfurtransferase
MAHVVELNRGPLIDSEPSARRIDHVPDGAQLLDVRPAMAVAKGHLPGVVGIPVSVTGFANRAGFVLDPDREVAILAAGSEEGAYAVRLLAAVGFTRLALVDRAVLDDAALERFRVLPASELGQPGLQVVDVREADEQDETVPGAICVPYRELAVAELDALDRDRPVATVCNSGVRAALAATLLARRGFGDVRPVLEGGMSAYLAGVTAAAR